MPRPPKSEVAPGIFLRGKIYWLRYTPTDGGTQVRVSLETDDKVKAITLAAEQRGRSIMTRNVAGKWDSQVAAYSTTKKKDKTFEDSTSTAFRHSASAFQLWSGVRQAEAVTNSLLQSFYDVHSKWRKPSKTEKEPRFRNVATAQAHTSRVATFLRSKGVRISIDFRGLNPNARDVIVSREQIGDLIENCPRLDLRFVLYAGFHAGMRKNEIVMARPDWFKLDLGHIAIPSIEVTNGKVFRPKSKRSRKIPLSAEFKHFLQQEFPGWQNQTFMLHPESQGIRYRWDFRRPFEEYMAGHNLWQKNGVRNASPHSMRHSFITHLADQKFTIAQISAWSGDRIRTLELNYLHTGPPSGAIDALYSIKKDLTLTQVLDAISDLKGQLDENALNDLQRKLTEAGKPIDQEWEWAKNASEQHVRLYSIKDTISNHEVFNLVVNSEEFNHPDDVVSIFDWEEGKVSTTRARLKLLEERDWIRRVT